MYNSGSVLGRSTTATSGTASVLGGAIALPYTSGNTLLTVLSYVTIVAGTAIVLSFVVTRILSRNYSK